MDHVSDRDIDQLAKRETVATLVPGANFFLGLEKFPPARKLIDAGVAVALATDYKPGLVPISQYAVRAVSGMHPSEDVTGGSDYSRDNQWRLGSSIAGTKGIHRAGQGRRSGGLRRRRLSRDCVLGCLEPLCISGSHGQVAASKPC